MEKPMYIASDGSLLRPCRKPPKSGGASDVGNRLSQVGPRVARHASLRSAAGRHAIGARPAPIKILHMYNGFGRFWPISQDPRNGEKRIS